MTDTAEGPGPGQAAPAGPAARAAASGGPPGGVPSVLQAGTPVKPLELWHRVAATAALAVIGVAFGGLMLARGHVAIGGMLLAIMLVLAPAVLLLAPAIFRNRRTPS